ncbi:thiol-disulfide oxidoreductase DCC family protein [Segetibacter koreensis]|uniref:thiol-disulfide oxidoreductase DCC family protein n=1 Tax=Segetibacter koreensis TaxID=398037 RepID=UPI000370FAB5|nr:thiol-disulfide oxidoreductase DCC family protein [Segetibacter koreensis]
MSDIDELPHPVILFDGVCNLCSGAVQFVIKRDKKDIFRFASLQSDYGLSVLKKFHLSTDAFNSFILYRSGKIYTKSTAALLVTNQLHGTWPLLTIFIFIPKLIRNGFYNLIARNRYRWFGKKEKCWVPSPDLQNKFLD